MEADLNLIRPPPYGNPIVSLMADSFAGLVGGG